MIVLERRLDGTYVIDLNGLPYHVVEDDPLFEEASNNDGDAPWEVVEETEPVPPPPLAALQLIIGLVKEGWISESEGDAWLDGTPPPQVDLLISQMPEAERFEARARAKRFTSVERDDPMVEGLGMIAGKTSEQLDAFFWEYSQI